MLRAPRRRPLLVVLAVLGGLLFVSGGGRWVDPAAAESPAPSPAKEKKEKRVDRAKDPRVQALPEKYRDFLRTVDLLISNAEYEKFLSLEKDYQRDAFIDRFWRMRDRDPRSGRNEFRDRWLALQEEVLRNMSSPRDERARFLLLNGPPADIIRGNCPGKLWPIEIWYYAGSDRARSEFVLAFYRPYGTAPFRLWQPADGLDVLFDSWQRGNRTLAEIADGCVEGRRIAALLAVILQQGQIGYATFISKIDSPPEPPSVEWVEAFDAYSTEVDDAAVSFDAKLEVAYPGRRQNRTVVQGLIAVPVGEAGVTELAGSRTYNFVLTGEILKDAALFESFRYKFDFSTTDVKGETIPLLFERGLRAGEYVLVLKVEDLSNAKVFRAEHPLSVPETDAPMPAPPPQDPESARLLAAATAALSTGENTLRIVPPRGDLLTGMTRFDTLSTGADISRVVFRLNEKNVLSDSKPPFGVELDLGSLPRTHALRATAYDPAGQEVASDEVLVNAGGTRFRIQLSEPRIGKSYKDSVRAVAELSVPAGEKVEKVEFYLNDHRVATLFGEPWVQSIPLPPGDRIGYVRAVAYLTDGNFTEDTAFVNAPEYLAEVEVQLVELYATVVDRAGRPVADLEQANFSVTEDDVPQELLRFEKVKNLPIHTGILFDVSASMTENLDATRRAALQFVQQTLQPKDRVALITFNDRPNLAVKFTREVDTFASGLAGLKAERGTALYDSVIFSLFYFNGIKGQKALLVLSDGKDEASTFSFDEMLEYAHRAGVTIYSIGLALPKGDPRKKLEKLAEETGGQAFFVEGPAELAPIYQRIEEELRSQYFLSYQSSNSSITGDFRAVSCKVDRPGLEVRTLRGYYP